MKAQPDLRRIQRLAHLRDDLISGVFGNVRIKRPPGRTRTRTSRLGHPNLECSITEILFAASKLASAYGSAVPSAASSASRPNRRPFGAAARMRRPHRSISEGQRSVATTSAEVCSASQQARSLGLARSSTLPGAASATKSPLRGSSTTRSTSSGFQIRHFRFASAAPDESSAAQGDAITQQFGGTQLLGSRPTCSRSSVTCPAKTAAIPVTAAGSGSDLEEKRLADDVLRSPEAGALVIRGGAVRTLGYGVGVGLTAVASILLLRHLGVADFGRFMTVTSLIAIVGGVTEAGLGGWCTRPRAAPQ